MPTKQKPNKKPKRQQTLAQWITRFDRTLQARNYSPNTRKAYRGRLHQFAQWASRDHNATTPKQITPQIIGDYQAWMVDTYRKERGGKLAVGTQAQNLAPLKTFFRWLHQRSQLDTDPAEELILPVKGRTLPRDVPTTREIGNTLRRLLRSNPTYATRDAAIVATLYTTGCRKMELSRLTLADVDLNKREIRIEKAKNRHGRITLLTPWARDLLAHYIQYERPKTRPHSQALFLSITGKHMPHSTLGRVVSEAFRPVRGKKVTCHSLRHGFCLSLLRGGAGIRIIAELAGHRSLASTAIYTRLELADLRKVHAKAFL